MKDTMTIADYLKEKADTEEKVRELLNNFSTKTGAEVLNIRFDVAHLIASKGGHIHDLEIETKL